MPLALNLRDRVDAEVRSEARSQADVVASSAADLVVPARRHDLVRLVERAAVSVRGRVVIVNGAGRVLVDSAGSASAGESFGGRPEIAATLEGRSVQTRRRSSTLGEELLATAVPIVHDGRPAGAVRITQSVEAVRRATWRAIAGLALVGGVVLLLGLGAGAIIARQVARPLLRLDAAARRVGEGDLAARAHVEGSAEQRSLARTFNEMTARLERLLRSQRDFVADASHQLRTPLTGLRLRVEEARAAASEPGVREDLDAALREVDRLSDIVAELLVLSRAGERDLPGEKVDLLDAARRAADRWQAAAAGTGQAVEASGHDGAATAWCARTDLDRALDALIENALRYSPAGARVEVLARPGAVAVLDEGPGLEPGEVEVVFERFHRGSAGRAGPGGTGLGLAIARELVRPWGGTVTLANRPEGGACATVALPAPGER